MKDFAEHEGCSLLRVYWYDGAFAPGTNAFGSQKRYLDAIASTPGVQLRLGHIKQYTPGWHEAVRAAIRECGWELAEFERHFDFRPAYEQKGVDTLIVLDIVRLAQRQAYDTGVLVAGDRDLAEAVRVAQDEGRRIILAHPAGGGVSTELRQLADEVHALDQDQLRQMLRVR
jgi:uncharacterized LabA/DUF88 family protein